MTRIEKIAEGVSLYLGDCREILPTLGKVEAVVTDPPYGIEGTWSGGNSHGWGKFRGEATAWDVRPEWLAAWLNEIECQKIIWGGNYFPLPPSGSWLVWDKDVRQFSAGHCELAWSNLGKPIQAFTIGRNHFTPEVLEARGWTFPGGLCVPPVPSHQPSQYEFACIGFLCDEWDHAYLGRTDLIETYLNQQRGESP